MEADIATEISEGRAEGAAPSGGKPARRLSTAPGSVARGLEPRALANVIGTLDGVVRDLQSWNPGRHQPNMSLWQHVTNRTVLVLAELRALQEGSGGDSA